MAFEYRYPRLARAHLRGTLAYVFLGLAVIVASLVTLAMRSGVPLERALYGLGCVVAVARRSEDDARSTHAELHRANTALVDAVQRDALTDAYNRGAFDKAIETSFNLHAVLGQPVTLIMIDLDHFKEVNDNHGHGAGDKVLQALSHGFSMGLGARLVVAAKLEEGWERAVLA